MMNETIIIPDDSPPTSRKNKLPPPEVETNDSNYDYKITQHEILRSVTGEYEVISFFLVSPDPIVCHTVVPCRYPSGPFRLWTIFLPSKKRKNTKLHVVTEKWLPDGIVKDLVERKGIVFSGCKRH